MVFLSLSHLEHIFSTQCIKNGVGQKLLTHWGQATHICIVNLTIIGSDDGLSCCWRQTTIWSNAGILLIEPSGTNISEILMEIQTFSSKKMHFKMSSIKWRPFCLDLNLFNKVLIYSVYLSWASLNFDIMTLCVEFWCHHGPLTRYVK